MRRAWNFIDRVGKRFGKLTVIELVKRPDRPKAAFWKCKCDCGNETIAFVGHLTHNHTTSCGCHALQRTSESHWKHGQAGNGKKRRSTPEYRVWHKMKQRCYDVDSNGYENYGGRGIRVCKRWLDGFQNFFDDMGKRPEGMSIERKDNNGNYEPSNCCWATKKTQSNNRRNNIQIMFNGRTQNLKQWCDEFGVKYKMAHKRIKHYGWTPEKAFTTPISIPGRPKGTKNGYRNQTKI